LLKEIQEMVIKDASSVKGQKDQKAGLFLCSRPLILALLPNFVT